MMLTRLGSTKLRQFEQGGDSADQQPVDVQDLWDLAKDLSNKYRLEPVNFADEFFKLALDCALPLMHARHIRRVVRKMRLRK